MSIADSSKSLSQSNFFSGILQSMKYKCKKLCFDLHKIKKIKTVYSMYGIPQDEEIIAFCKSTTVFLPIAMDGVIFTNRAVHFYATLEKDTSSIIRKIPYYSFGQYIFTQEGSKGKVCAHASDSDIQILGETIFAENAAGAEILRVLKEIQSQLRKRDYAVNTELEQLAMLIIEKAKTDMVLNELSPHADHLLSAILFDYQFNAQIMEAAAYVKAEYLFRQCDFDKYQNFIKSLPSQSISNNSRRNLINVPEVFVSNLISILTNLEVDLDYSIMSKLYNRIGEIEATNNQYKVIYTYLCIRLNEHVAAEQSIKYIRSTFGNHTANQIEWFKGIFYYDQMHRVYEKIRKGENISTQYISICDGLGLTPLHYAIILKKETAIAGLLKNGHWKANINDCKMAAVCPYYEYSVLACGKQVSNLQNILEKTHLETATVKKKIDHAQNRIKELNVKLQIQKTNLSIGQTKRTLLKIENSDSEKIEELTAKIDSLKGYIQDTTNSIQDYTNELHEYEQELLSAMEGAIDDALQALGTMKESKDPFTQYLYRIFFEPDFFDRILIGIKRHQDLCLYQYRDFYFIAPQFAQIALPNISVEKPSADRTNEESNDSIPSEFPLYGTTWFSPTAHMNLDVLKKEYRCLAKLYHPDVSKHPDSKRLFQVISAEYNELSEILNQEN